MCSCYASPIKRAAHFAEIMWEGRETPLVHTDSLKEAYLGWLQGMKQGALIIGVLRYCKLRLSHFIYSLSSGFRTGLAACLA